jgi:penicillin-binding protein 2
MKNLEGRQFVYLAMFIGVGLIFILRLFFLQVVDEKYKQKGDMYAIRRLVQHPPRGNVLDRNGKLMVANEYAFDLMVVMKETTPFDTLLLCSLADIEKTELVKAMDAIVRRKGSRKKATQPEPVVKELSQVAVAALQEKLFKFPGFFLEKRTIRRYPQAVGAAVLGYIAEVDTAITNHNPYYKPGDYIGKSGVEQSYEDVLRGTKGVKKVYVDVTNNERGSFGNGAFDTAAVPGKNLITTLDLDLQALGESLMQNKKGAIVAIEPSTGEILALISAPTYDPNLMVGRNLRRNYPKLLLDPNKPMYNRATMDGYPPGSTFKVMNALIGQQFGVLFNDTRVPCGGGFRISAAHSVGCHAHPTADLKFSIQTSCNAYYCWVFNEMLKSYPNTREGYVAWREAALRFGFGQNFQTDLPNVKNGNLPTAEYYDKVYGKGGWRGLTIISLGIGQGEMKANALQIANLAAIVANRGYYITPHIGKRVGGEELARKGLFPRKETRIDTAYFDVVVRGMYGAVHEPGGTARMARLDSIVICGKTGTAQNPHGKDHSVFMAFAPMHKPKIAIGILVENAGFGATWAAPIASLMIEKYLTDTITRPDLETRMREGNLLSP